jgi:hypothetical protein
LEAEVLELLSVKRNCFQIHHFREHPKLTLYSYSFGFVMNIPDQGLVQMVVVDVLSHFLIV